MNISLKHPPYLLPVVKIILFALACIAIFVAAAGVAQLLTFLIGNQVLKTAISEILVRTPLTVIALHFFATKVIKTYSPVAIYGKLVFTKVLKWTAIAFILPLTVGFFYYFFHLMAPYRQTVELTGAGKAGTFITWVSISISAGITEEVLFRGHLYMIIRSRCSVMLSAFISSLIFGLVHIAMLPSFTLLDIAIVVTGGTVAGLMFSLIYLYSKSLWYAAIVHAIWDVFFIGKITAIATTQADANQAIMPFKLVTHSEWLTGGSFGVEAALPSLLLYLVVIGVLYGLMQSSVKSSGRIAQ